MSSISTNSIGVTVVLLEAILSSFGVEFEAGTVAKAVEGIVVALSLALLLINQMRRKDIRGFFFRKN